MSNSRKVIGALLVAIAAAIIIPIFWGDVPIEADRAGEDPWRTFIFDFQTLFTGIAAVAAATWTVFTMERTDARQEQRHRELVTLSLRADRLRADRAINPQLEDFEYYVDDNLAVLTRRFASYANAYGAFDDGERSYREWASTIEGFFNRAQMAQAQDLFDGEMAYALERIRDAIQRLEICWVEAERYSPPVGMARTQLTLTEEERIKALVTWRRSTHETNRCLEALAEYTSRFYGGLVKLKKTYDA